MWSLTFFRLCLHCFLENIRLYQATEMQNREYHVIYPAYINSNHSTFRGRRIAKNKCVADPKLQEIRNAFETIQGIEIVEEPNKLYPRELDKESPQFRGRIKYKILSNCKFASRKEILLYIGETVIKIRNRNKGQAASQTQEQINTNAGKKKKSRR